MADRQQPTDGRYGRPREARRSPVVLRPITVADIPGFHAALDAVAREARWIGLTEAPPLEETESFVRTNLALGLPHFLAVAGGEVIGWCDVSVPGRPAMRHVGRIGMGLREGHRGRGLGRRLLEATLAATEELNLTRIELEVLADNPVALRLYESLGFEREGIRRGAIRLAGKTRDLVMMSILRE